MNNVKTVYATIGDHKLGASDREGDEMVSVWITSKPESKCRLYKIERFRDNKLTESTLKELFTPKK